MLFINDGNINNLQYLLYRITQQIQIMNQNPELSMRLGGSIPDETARMAMVIVTIGPIIFLYPFVQKYFVKGLVIGAVKG
jgi:ABC-type glycerol-3-phosphate transport system permease component